MVVLVLQLLLNHYKHIAFASYTFSEDHQCVRVVLNVKQLKKGRLSSRYLDA